MNPDLIWRYAPSLISGFGVTILCWGAGAALGLLLGFAIAVLNRLPLPPLRWALRVFVEVFRGTPFLMQLFLLYAGGPSIGLKLNATTAGIVGLGLYSSAYFAEIFRGGFSAVPIGQIEAAVSIGMAPFDTMMRVMRASGVDRRGALDRQHADHSVEGDGGAVDHHRSRAHVSGADDGGGDIHCL